MAAFYVDFLVPRLTLLTLILLLTIGGQAIWCIALARKCGVLPHGCACILDALCATSSRMVKRPKQPAFVILLNRFPTWSVIWYVGILPVVYFVLSALSFSSGYQGEKSGNWTSHIHEGMAGYVGLPLFAVASMFLIKSMLKPEYREKSGSALAANLILILLCAHYTYACLFMDFVKGPVWGNMLILALVPGISGLCYLFFLLETLSIRDKLSFSRSQAAAWLVGITATIAAKIFAAQQVFNALP
jgi:hypothetical protein